MYIPPLFREERAEVLVEAMQRYPLATLVTLNADGLRSSQIPLLYDGSVGPHGVLRGHVARANTQWQDINANVAGLALFHGPQHYISPSWYPSKSEHGMVVPTWNYVVVEAKGPVRAIDDREWLLKLVNDLTLAHEADQARPWRVEDAPSDYIQKLLESIVGIELSIQSLQGKWKMSQNRPEKDRTGAIKGLTEIGTPEALDIAALIRERDS